MTVLAEEFYFVVAPSLDSPLSMSRYRATTRTFEICLFGPAFGKEPAYKGQDNKSHDYRSKDEFR